VLYVYCTCMLLILETNLFLVNVTDPRQDQPYVSHLTEQSQSLATTLTWQSGIPFDALLVLCQISECHSPHNPEQRKRRTATMATLLKKFVDAAQWNAEDVAGRLGIVLHAAFLFAGFQPYGRQPRSGHLRKEQSRKTGGSACLCRMYTAPHLAQREGADAAVLMLCVQGSDAALLVFITSDGDDTPENAYLERLDLKIVRPLLSRSLGGVEPWASRICKSLADGLCWCFLDKLCRRNGLALSGFSSLHDDLRAVVLEKLTDGKDLARVECVSSQLRLLVAERGQELWRTLYKALPSWQCLPSRYRYLPKSESPDAEAETLNIASIWKHKYAQARRRPDPTFRNLLWHFDFDDDYIQLFCHVRPSIGYCFVQDPSEKGIPPRVDRSGGGHRRRLARDDRKKWHGGGAINSPSSRYRWKHR
jgi:hypothetical protein